MIHKIKSIRIVFFFVLMAFLIPSLKAQEQITSPEEYFGFQMGADQKIARWDKMVDYFLLLEKQSTKIKVINMGPSTMGNPFLLVIISSADNLKNLDQLQEINATLSDPRDSSEQEIKKMIPEGKAVIAQSMSLHASEIGPTQMSPELAYDLLSRTDKETQVILDNVLYFMFPCFNPDGEIMVTDFYREYVGTEFEGTSLPWLYHKYAGHDNNRDGDYLNLVESKYAAQILYRDWIPQAYIDHHQMGSYGARLYIPPYCDPIRPFADPLVWREMSWYGAHLAYKLEENLKTGIINDAMFPGWGHFGWHWITPFHNIAGMLTESASTELASPLYIHPSQLRGGSRQFPEYEAQSTFPHPWPGGWWTLRDIVEQTKVSAWALLDIAARHKETVLWNAYLKAKRQTERGAKGKPCAYVIPKSQHDFLSAVKMVNTLLLSGIEIKAAQSSFSVDGLTYPKGSFIISLAQPKMGLIRNLIGRTFYADNEWTRADDGSPLRPYDLATHTMNEFMGVRVDPIDEPVEGDFEVIQDQFEVNGKVGSGADMYVLDGRMNNSFWAVNLLLDKNVTIMRADHKTSELNPGDFIVAEGSETLLRDVADLTGVDFTSYNGEPSQWAHELKRGRIGMYQRYFGGNMDEGWTRLVLENFGFPYTRVKDKEIQKGNLSKDYDVFIFPDDSAAVIKGEIPERYRRYYGSYPPEYRSGIGKQGVEEIKSFVQNGGILVTLGDACSFAIEEFGLNVRNVLSNMDSKEFFCPGSTLKVTFDHQNPLAYGMPSEGLVLFRSSPAYEIIPGDRNQDYEVIVRYQDRDLLRSGWLIGEQHLSEKAGMLTAQYGEGQIVLIGFRTQHRCQTDGTFKLLFNTFLH
ncbi:MAG: peptidase M14 family protein [Candidatus Aminicenantes bacterium]|nr:peptidase M14 family protein [Candidatus Aminicenantes bacterium]